MTFYAGGKLPSQSEYSSELLTSWNAVSFPDTRVKFDVDGIPTGFQDAQKGRYGWDFSALLVGGESGVGGFSSSRKCSQGQACVGAGFP